VSENWSFSQFLSLKKHREWEPSAVGFVNFLNFACGVAEEIVQSVELLTTVVASVIPFDAEGKDIAVIFQEAVQIFVGTSSLKHNFDIVFVLSQIGWVLFEVDHCTSCCKGVFWEWLTFTEVYALISIELVSKLIAVNDSEDAAVNIQIHSKFQVGPFVSLVLNSLDWKLVSLKENTLRNSWILNAILNDVQCVVFEVEVDDAFAYAEVFIAVFNNWLLEVGFEIEDLKVKGVINLNWIDCY